MLQGLIAVVVVLTLAVLALLVWLVSSSLAARREVAGQAGGIALLQQQLDALKAAQDRTSQTLCGSLQAGQSTLTQSLHSNQQILQQLNTQIGELQGTNKQMLRLGADVKRLQDILASPKLRGQTGEWSLENLLAHNLVTFEIDLVEVLRKAPLSFRKRICHVMKLRRDPVIPFAGEGATRQIGAENQAF
jgi:type II secretory pathway pseudopilin PulG